MKNGCAANFDALDNCHHHEMRIPWLDRKFRVSTRALQKEVIAPIYQLLSFSLQVSYRKMWILSMRHPGCFTVYANNLNTKAIV